MPADTRSPSDAPQKGVGSRTGDLSLSAAGKRQVAREQAEREKGDRPGVPPCRTSGLFARMRGAAAQRPKGSDGSGGCNAPAEKAAGATVGRGAEGLGGAAEKGETESTSGNTRHVAGRCQEQEESVEKPVQERELVLCHQGRPSFLCPPPHHSLIKWGISALQKQEITTKVHVKSHGPLLSFLSIKIIESPTKAFRNVLNVRSKGSTYLRRALIPQNGGRNQGGLPFNPCPLNFVQDRILSQDLKPCQEILDMVATQGLNSPLRILTSVIPSGHTTRTDVSGRLRGTRWRCGLNR